jgi:hypothetical protein
MNQPVSAFPDPPENIDESFEPKVGKNPLNEENDREVGHNEVVAKDNTQV